MFGIKYRGDDKKLRWLKIEGQRVELPTRQKARSFCINHMFSMVHEGFVIVHPDGNHEDFVTTGLCHAQPLKRRADDQHQA